MLAACLVPPLFQVPLQASACIRPALHALVPLWARRCGALPQSGLAAEILQKLILFNSVMGSFVNQPQELWTRPSCWSHARQLTAID